VHDQNGGQVYGYDPKIFSFWFWLKKFV